MPAGVRPCRTADLNGRYLGWRGATGGQVTGAIGLANRGEKGCLLVSPAGLRFVDAAGRVVLTAAAARGTHDFVVLEPGPGDLPSREEGGLRAGQGLVGFVWSNRCAETIDIAAFWLTIPGDSAELVVRRDPSQPLPQAGCIGPEYPMRLAAWGFEPVLSPAEWGLVSPPPSPRLAASIEAPPTALAGRVLGYAVTLTNVSGEPVRFDTGCPGYTEWILPKVAAIPPPAGKIEPAYGPAAVAKESYALNCRAVGALLPGSSVTFEMRIALPSDSRTGPGRLSWALFGGTAAASAPLTITAP